MTQPVATLIAAIIAAVVGITTALLTTAVTMRLESRRAQREERAERTRDREKKRIQYLDPLVVAATDLLAKIKRLQAELPTKEQFWRDTFNEVKTHDRERAHDFAFWCNGYGAGAVTTLYVTSVYFARASKIRSELPFIDLGAADDRLLLSYLTEVRDAFGGEHNLWVEVQDSLGDYLTGPDGRIMNYRDFCTQLIDGWKHIWFTRLIDFYRDIHMKDREMREIVRALERLIEFVKRATAAPRATAGAG